MGPEVCGNARATRARNSLDATLRCPPEVPAIQQPDDSAVAEESDLAAQESHEPVPAAHAAGTTPGVWEIAWPAIVGNLLASTVGFVDIKIVGSLGGSAVAAVTTGNRLFFILQAVFMAVTAGTTALVARAWGAGDRAEAERVTRASLCVCLVLAALLTLPAVAFADVFVQAFRLDAQTLALAASFIRWLAVFNAPFAVFFVLGVALRAAGDTRTPLWVGALTNVVNICLVYALVYGRFGLPQLGVAGAALASGLAFSAGALVLTILWLRGRLRITPGPPGALERGRIRRLVRIGAPAALEQVVWQGGFLAFLWIVALYGTAPYAAYGIGVSILSFSFVVGFGFQVAASTVVGQRLGARDPEGAARSGWRATRLSVLAMVVLGVGIILGARRIAEFMIDDPEVVRLTVLFIWILGAVQPLMAIEFAIGGSLRGAGDTRFPLLAVLTGLVGVRVALASLFAWLGLSVGWIYGALIGDYIVKASMLTARFVRGRWKTIRV
jgi:putative MATE family efflux protein